MESEKRSPSNDIGAMNVPPSAKFSKPPLDIKQVTATTPTINTPNSSASSTNQFSASYQASGASVMSFPDPDIGNHDSLALNPQTQQYLTAFNTPDSISFDSVVFDNANDLIMDPLNQSTAQYDSNSASFADISEPRDEDEDITSDNMPCPSGSEATGRWTKKEHELFTQALSKYGKEWKKVAAMVKTRTVVQTRTHAQKYFQKVMKGESETSSNVPTDQTTIGAFSSHALEKRPRILNEPKTFTSSRDSTDSVNPREGENNNTEDYFYYESELPSKKRQTTYYGQSASNTFSSAVKKIPEEELPPPSPASCGKRKDAEISAVMSLMGSTPTANAMENGIHTLARMREAYRKPVLTHLMPMEPLPLSIVKPGSLPASERESPPETPWNEEMLALESRRMKRLFVEAMNEVPVSEQDEFMQNVKQFVVAGDVSSLTGLLQGAKFSEDNTFISLDAVIAQDIGVGGEVSASQKISSDVGTPFGAPNSRTQAISEKGSRSEGRSQSLLADMLNRLDDSGNSILHIACGSEVSESALNEFHAEGVVLEMCKILVENGASVSLVNSKLQSCVHLACSLRYQSVVKLLIMKGCPVNCVDQNGDCASHVAARHCDVEMLRTLTDSGVNCHIRNKNASCALDLLDDCEEKNLNRQEVRTELLAMEPRLRTLILYHEDCLEHAARRESDWEGPDRLQGIMTTMHNAKLFPSTEVEISNQFQKAHVELLSRVHCPEYIAFVNALSKKVQESCCAGESATGSTGAVVPFTPQVQMKMFQKESSDTKADINCDTSFSAGTLKAARRAAGAVAHAVDRVLLGRNRNAFCVVRPPGHHAGYRGLLDGAKSCGFCIFNNVAAGALHALETHHCQRVAIIDIDVHHGNGTEDIVRRYPFPSRLFFFSLHLYDKPEGEQSGDYEFFPGSGRGDDTAHNIINVPLLPLWHEAPPKSGTRATAKSSSHHPSRSGRDAYKQAISQRLIPALRAFCPDLILLSTGFDAAEGDVGNVKNESSGTASATGGIARGLDLRPIDFEWTTTELLKVADICCSGRVVSVLEGGYGSYPSAKKSPTVGQGLDRDILSECSAAHVDRLIDPYGQSYEETHHPL